MKQQKNNKKYVVYDMCAWDMSVPVIQTGVH